MGDLFQLNSNDEAAMVGIVPGQCWLDFSQLFSVVEGEQGYEKVDRIDGAGRRGWVCG